MLVIPVVEERLVVRTERVLREEIRINRRRRTERDLGEDRISERDRFTDRDALGDAQRDVVMPVVQERVKVGTREADQRLERPTGDAWNDEEDKVAGDPNPPPGAQPRDRSLGGKLKGTVKRDDRPSSRH